MNTKNPTGEKERKKIAVRPDDNVERLLEEFFGGPQVCCVNVATDKYAKLMFAESTTNKKNGKDKVETPALEDDAR